MIKNVEQVIREYLPDVIHMSLATSSMENSPWICEVHYVYDEDLNLYFRSTQSRRHSLEIAVNPKVAGNIIKSYKVGDKVRGVYFEGTACVLNEVDESHIAYKLYCKRFSTDSKVLDDARKDDGHKFYKIEVANYYLFDSIESSPSQKYELKWGNR